MRTTSFENEASECRRLAAEYSEQPEGAFLLRLAGAFEALIDDAAVAVSASLVVGEE
jgi:hypothetical protein